MRLAGRATIFSLKKRIEVELIGVNDEGQRLIGEINMHGEDRKTHVDVGVSGACSSTP